MSEPRRILVLNFEYPPIGGGGASATKYLFDELANDENLELDLVTSTMGNERVEEDHCERIHLIRLPVGKRELHFWRQDEVMRYIFAARNETRRLLNHRKYDLIHAIFGFPAGFVAFRLRRRLPYIVSLHGTDVPGFNRRFAIQYPILRPVFRRIWREAKAVTIVSEALRELAYETDPKANIQVVPNGVDMSLFRPPEEDRPPGKRLVAVCRLIERKNLHLLLDVLPRVRERHPDVTLDIIGDGDQREALESQSKDLGLTDIVTFRGRVPHEELPREYHAADLFVLPSEWEGLPITLLEAMACGLPAVVTEGGGSKEVLHGNGLLIPVGDRDWLERSINQLLDRPDRLRNMGKRSVEIAREYRWDRVADMYRSLYDEAIRGAPSGEPRSVAHG